MYPSFIHYQNLSINHLAASRQVLVDRLDDEDHANNLLAALQLASDGSSYIEDQQSRVTRILSRILSLFHIRPEGCKPRTKEELSHWLRFTDDPKVCIEVIRMFGKCTYQRDRLIANEVQALMYWSAMIHS